jgi:ribosomal protein S18 acetylase RimI-like enzyme
MIYRPFRPEDLPALYAIEEICFQPPLRFSRAFMQRLVNSDHAATWIAEEGPQMAGFAIVVWTVEEGGLVGYIQTIEVLPAMRRRGVGGELMRCVEQSAKRAGAEAIWLHVDAENAGAIRLYEARGYRHEGREANYYPRGRTALVYAKALDRPDEKS